MASSSTSEPCSMERAPARTARLMPSAPCACAATNVPYSAASSTAARISSSLNSGAPGAVPRVSTAPVAMTLMKSAPRWRISRTTRRISSTEFATPNRSSRGTSRSGATGGMSPPPLEIGDERSGALHPRPDDIARVDRVAEGDVDEGPEGPDVADGGEPGHHGVACVAHARESFLRARPHEQPGVLAPFQLPHEVRVAVDEAGHDGVL